MCVNVNASQAGSLLELLGMVPIGGLELQLKPLALTGVAGWDGLGAAAVREWITHLAHTQVRLTHVQVTDTGKNICRSIY